MSPLVFREQGGKAKGLKAWPAKLQLAPDFCGHFFGVKMNKIMGFGVNDADYAVYSTVDGKVSRCPAYVAWMAMLTRCYSDNFKARFPTYDGVTVCDEWSSFMSFRGWWVDHQVDGWEIDKDILTDERVYSPDTCIYIPAWLNSFVSNSKGLRGGYPIGVSIDSASGKFVARCKNALSGRSGYIGRFDTIEQAHAAWMQRKLGIALELKPMMDAIDERIYKRVVKIISKMR